MELAVLGAGGLALGLVRFGSRYLANKTLKDDLLGWALVTAGLLLFLF